MFNDGVIGKMRAEKQNAAMNDLYPQDPPSGPDICAGKAKAPQRPSRSDEPLTDRLRFESMKLEEEYVRKQRAVDILERHPEFAELMELLRLVPLY